MGFCRSPTARAEPLCYCIADSSQAEQIELACCAACTGGSVWPSLCLRQVRLPVKSNFQVRSSASWVGFAWNPRPLALQAPQLQASLSIPPASSPGPGAFCILADAITGGSVGTRAAGHAAAPAYGRVWQDAYCCPGPAGGARTPRAPRGRGWADALVRHRTVTARPPAAAAAAATERRPPSHPGPIVHTTTVE